MSLNQLDYDLYKEQHERVRKARILILASITLALRGCILEQITTLPIPGAGPATVRQASAKDIYDTLKVRCKMNDPKAVALAHQRIVALEFTNKMTISEFYNQLELLQQDIVELKGTYGDDQFMTKMVKQHASHDQEPAAPPTTLACPTTQRQHDVLDLPRLRGLVLLYSLSKSCC